MFRGIKGLFISNHFRPLVLLDGKLFLQSLKEVFKHLVYVSSAVQNAVNFYAAFDREVIDVVTHVRKQSHFDD